MESENLKDKIQQQVIENNKVYELTKLVLKQDDFIRQGIKFLNDLRQNADNLTFAQEYNQQYKKRFISEIERIKSALAHNRLVDMDFKLNMAILLVELPTVQREIFYLIGFKSYNIQQTARERGKKPQSISNSLEQMFKYFLYGIDRKYNIATKTIFKDVDKSYRHDEVKEIQSLCANAPIYAEIIINDLLNDFILLDKNKQEKDCYIDKLFEMYTKRENKDIQPDDFYIL